MGGVNQRCFRYHVPKPCNREFHHQVYQKITGQADACSSMERYLFRQLLMNDSFQKFMVWFGDIYIRDLVRIECFSLISK